MNHGRNFQVMAAKRSDHPRLARLLAGAFRDEPAQRWLFPDARVRAAATRLWFRAMLEAADLGGAVWCVSDQTAASIWFGPGGHRETQGPSDWLYRVILAASRPARRRMAALEEALRVNRPCEAHWHLAAVGTEAGMQGQGRGRAVLEPAVSVCDADRLMACLETSEPKSLPFYQALGFTVHTTFLPADGPRVWCMRRRPRV